MVYMNFVFHHQKSIVPCFKVQSYVDEDTKSKTSKNIKHKMPIHTKLALVTQTTIFRKPHHIEKSTFSSL